MELYFNLITSCMLKWSINPISNPKPRRVTHTRDNMDVYMQYVVHYTNEIVYGWKFLVLSLGDVLNYRPRHIVQ
jgi:hypothetical protein